MAGVAATPWVPMCAEMRDDLFDKIVCIPTPGVGMEYISNLSLALAPRGPVHIELVAIYTQLYAVMTPPHLIDTVQVIFSLREKPSDVILLVLRGQAMRYGYIRNPFNAEPSMPRFLTAIYRLTGAVMEWELGIVAYTQGLSMQQTLDMYERYRSVIYRRRGKRRELFNSV